MATSECQACVLELALHIARQWSVPIRATEQAMMEAQSIRHACSARLRINHPSWRDFALANKLTNCRASSDHRPDALIPKTTNRALARGPTSSGYLFSFRRLAAVKATPSTSAAPFLAVPSPRRVLTMVASIASCGPPNNGNPSTATSSLRASTCPGPGPSKSRFFTKTFLVTRPPANARCCAFQSKPPLARHPCTCASCPVMAKDVKEVATPAVARNERYRHLEAAYQEHAEDLGIKPCETARRACGECNSSASSCLGAHQSPGCLVHPGKQIRLAERLMDSGRSLVLPPSPHTTRLKIFRLSIWSSGAFCLLPPRGRFESHGSNQLPPGRGSLLESRRRGNSFQLSNQLCCNGWVSGSYHWQAI